jgi:hypothetical protein
MAKKLKQPEKKMVGWREWIHLPELSPMPIKAKIDTGAKTSTLHAKNIVIQQKPRKKFVSFELYPAKRSKTRIHVRCELIDQRKVKSSVGNTTERPVIRTDVLIGEDRFPIELTLVNRSMMGYRMLLGRRALKKKYIVNPSRSFLTRKTKKKS